MAEFIRILYLIALQSCLVGQKIRIAKVADIATKG